MEGKIKKEFAERLTESIGSEAASVVLDALHAPPTVAVRLNPCKFTEALQPWLKEGIPVEWCPYGLRLSHRPEFALDPLWHAGAYYVQETASMVFSVIIHHLLEERNNPEPGLLLDLCAAPGGKTTSVLSTLEQQDGWITVANDIILSRALVLRENLEKWGSPNVIVTNGSPEAVCGVGEIFDVVITDVPCSGEGMMRKETMACSQWTPALVEHCANLQRDIINKAVAALKPGGFLIYSTCTFNTTENEQNIRWACEAHGLETLRIPISDTAGIRGGAPGYEDLPIIRFMPGYTDSEGLTVCVLRKPDQTHRGRLKSSSAKSVRLNFDWLKGNPDLYKAGETIFALDSRGWPLMEALRKRCKVLSGGTPIATVLTKGNKPQYEPTHALAMSQLLNKEYFPLQPLTEQQALGYLRRETAGLPVTPPRGFQIPTYGTLPLGLIKNVGNRVNNLYPTGLRLRKQ